MELGMKKSKLIIIFAVPALVLGLTVMTFAGRRLNETRQVYREGNSVYDNLSNQIRKLPSVETQPLNTMEIAGVEVTTMQAGEPRMNIYIPEYEIDFEMLRTINGDATAWLYSPGTVIDYPVLKADDYYYYLNHLIDGTTNANGSLFIDYNNAPDFSDRLTVIYGHHMKSGSMFGSLVGYKDQQYYNEHPYMYLYTEQGNYRIDLMYGVVIGAGQWKEQAFMYEENLEALLEYAMNNTTFVSEVNTQEGDRIVVLSTCSYEFDEARYFVVGRLIRD